VAVALDLVRADPVDVGAVEAAGVCMHVREHRTLVDPANPLDLRVLGRGRGGEEKRRRGRRDRRCGETKEHGITTAAHGQPDEGIKRGGSTWAPPWVGSKAVTLPFDPWRLTSLGRAVEYRRRRLASRKAA